MTRSLVLVFACSAPVLLAAPAALAQDAGPTAPTACGALDDEGVCFADVATWCSEPNAAGADAFAPTERFDCGAVVVDGRAVQAACVELAGFGAWCGVEEGERCLVPSADGARQLACLSAGVVAVDGACDLERGCVRGLPACADDGPACENTFLRLGCSAFGQARGVDCAAIGGACTDAACTGVPENGPCDRERLRCAADLECTGAATGAGVCLPIPEAADRAERDVDPPPDPAPSCGALGAGSGRLWPLGLLGFLFFSGILRRRIRRSTDAPSPALGG